MSEKPVGGLDTDQLMHELGHFRRFHVISYLLVTLVVVVSELYSINYVFLAADVPYR